MIEGDGTKTRIRTVFLGLDHPHIWSRLEFIEHRYNDFEILGLYDPDPVQAQKFHSLKGYAVYNTPEELLSLGAEICFVHSLEHDACRLALIAARNGVKGLLLEKFGAANPQEMFETLKELTILRPDIVIEWGWEMHYSDAMEKAHNLLKNRVLGDITTAHFHGGCPSGSGFEKWQSLDSTIGGFAYTICGHTIEQVASLFGVPDRLVSSVRTLPDVGEVFPAVVVCEDMFKPPLLDTVPVKVGTYATASGTKREDICSVLMEYPRLNVTVDLTGWEPTTWCADWTTDIYGTNGAYHFILDPPKLSLYLREARAGYSAGESRLDEFGETAPPRCIQKYFFRQMDTFLEWVRIGQVKSNVNRLGSCGIPLQMEIMQIMDMIFKSARSHSWVDSPNFMRTPMT